MPLSPCCRCISVIFYTCCPCRVCRAFENHKFFSFSVLFFAFQASFLQGVALPWPAVAASWGGRLPSAAPALGCNVGSLLSAMPQPQKEKKDLTPCFRQSKKKKKKKHNFLHLKCYFLGYQYNVLYILMLFNLRMPTCTLNLRDTSRKFSDVGV